MNSWENTVAGYIIGLKSHLPTLISHLSILWGLKGSIEAFSRGNGFFLLQFSDPDEMAYALENGPWYMKGKPIIMKKWEIGDPLEKENLSSVPVWLRVHDMLMELWSQEIFARIEKFLGKPLCSDRATLLRRRLEYGRISVLMKADGCFPLSMPLVSSSGVKHTVRLEYEFVPGICSHCGLFGHKEFLCRPKESYRRSSHPMDLPPIIPPTFESGPAWIVEMSEVDGSVEEVTEVEVLVIMPELVAKEMDF